MIQVCIDCKKEFEDPAPVHGGCRKQRCEACRKLHAKQLAEAARERHKAAIIARAKAEAKERKAEEAGTLDAAANAEPEFMSAAASQKLGKPHFRAPKNSGTPKGKCDHLSVEEVSKLADAAGMSYGMYVALKLNRVKG